MFAFALNFLVLGLITVDFFKEPFVKINNGVVVAIIFLVWFFAFVILVYVLSFKEDEDHKSPIRKRLQGIWKVRYQTWRYGVDGKIVEDSARQVCVIKIDLYAKLYFVINADTEENDIYQAGEFKVEDVAINTNSRPTNLNILL